MRRIGLSLGLLTAAGTTLVASGGCTTNPINSALRALEESGRVSFVCLGDPASPNAARPLEDCRNRTAESNNDYVGGAAGADGLGASGGAGGAGGAGGSGVSSAATNETPHLYALVTQTFRGEVDPTPAP